MAEKGEKEFLSFDEALRELRLKEEELKRLVSEGEIRAFRDGETMKLRKSDVENLRSELSGGEVVDLGTASEELVFEDDTDLDAGMATEEISEADTILEEAPADEVELEPEEKKPVAPARRAAAVRSSRAAAAPVEDVDDDADVNVGAGWMAAAVVTSLVMVLTVPVCLAISEGYVNSLAKSIAGVFANV